MTAPENLVGEAHPLLSRLKAIHTLTASLREEASHIISKLPDTLNSVKYLVNHGFKLQAILKYRKIFPLVTLEVAKLWVEQYIEQEKLLEASRALGVGCTDKDFPLCPICGKSTEQRYINSYGQCTACYDRMIQEATTNYPRLE